LGHADVSGFKLRLGVIARTDFFEKTRHAVDGTLDGFDDLEDRYLTRVPAQLKTASRASLTGEDLSTNQLLKNLNKIVVRCSQGFRNLSAQHGSVRSLLRQMNTCEDSDG
jgi:hypothetical protein